MFEVRPCRDVEEFMDAIGAISQYFGAERNQERAERFIRNHPLERMHAAFDDGRVVGGAGAFPFQLSVPGAVVPAAGVTVVGVNPTHRRRGVLTAMMRAQLDDAHERGDPLAVLWASEERIYPRFGYGLASLAGEASISREHAGFAYPFKPTGTVRLVDVEEALELFPPVWDRLLPETPGMFTRSREWWELRVFLDPAERRPTGAGPSRLVALEVDGSVEGYAMYRHQPDWESGFAAGKLNVTEALAVGAQATRELWRYLLDIDWSATIVARLLPIDHPLFLILAEPRRIGFRVHDALWLRLVDVGAALSARGYAADGAVVLEVVDEFCPWNACRWRLEGGEAARTDREPDLRLDVQGLACVYLGGFTFGELARSGRVDELNEGALARADAMFRVDGKPWCPEIF
jgi:predicted acetyltransferase